MFEEIKDCLTEVIELAEKCPDKYQVKCFEVLLESLLRAEPIKGDTYTPPSISASPSHVFFAQYDILESEWQNVYHFDGSSYMIIVKDLKEKTAAKRQVRLGLLLGIKNLLETNESLVLKEDLIEICKNYSSFDSKNFAHHMKRNKNLFLSKGGGWVLTVPGQKEAAAIIKELA